MDIQDLYRARKSKADFNRPDIDSEETIGTGIQSMVYVHPRDKSKVVKIADIKNPDNDSYLEFVRLIVSHQDNPFFPRIYNVKLYEKPPEDRTRSEGDYRLVMVMERLYSIWDLMNNHRYMKAALDELVSLGIPDSVTQEYIDSQEDPTVLWDYFEDTDNIEDLIQYSDNHSFREAMNTLVPYMRSFGQDMHMGNIMVRPTKNGIQLVIIDPLAASLSD